MLDHVSGTRKQEDVTNRLMVAYDQVGRELTTAHSYATSRQVALEGQGRDLCAIFSLLIYIYTYSGDCGTSQTHDLDRGREMHIRVGKLQGSGAT
jgi:hypothetical protein